MRKFIRKWHFWTLKMLFSPRRDPTMVGRGSPPRFARHRRTSRGLGAFLWRCDPPLEPNTPLMDTTLAASSAPPLQHPPHGTWVSVWALLGGVLQSDSNITCVIPGIRVWGNIPITHS